MNRTSLITVTTCALCLATAAPASADYTGNPLDGSNGFGVVVEGDATLGSTETEGAVAIGGDLTLGPGYNVGLRTPGTFVAPGDTVPTTLLVNGRVDWAAGSQQGVLRVLSGGYLKVGDPAGSDALDRDANGAQVNTREVVEGAGYDSTPRIETTARQSEADVHQSGLMNFGSAFAAFRERSTDIAACPSDVLLRDDQGEPLPDQDAVPSGSRAHIALTGGRTNILDITGENLNNFAELDFDDEPTATTPLVINVDTSGSAGIYSWSIPELAGVSGNQAPYILWNFPDATDITITDGDSLEGTIYAPRAKVTDLDPSNIEGQIVARELIAGPLTGGGSGAVNAGEIHEFPFDADITCTSTPTPTPTPTDPTPTPTDPTPTPTDPTPTPTDPTPTPTDPTPTPTPTDPTPTPTDPTPTPTEPTPGPSWSSGAPHPTPSDPYGPDHELADSGSSGTGLLAGGALLAAAGGLALKLRRRPRH
ncbi:collagen-binding domain-containing protein [Streptomyces sp. bgisy029]|uniref:collagen-binding domain-containing protein n=1 Tax=Streptomyces sp. bgisy029 TaxID=3413771 RepID=UPI003D70D32C